MITKNITLNQEPLFWLEDKFYKVKPQASEDKTTSKIEFPSKCPSCNDTRWITYKGYDGNDFKCRCPICNSSMYHGYGNKITLTNWEIHEYIVYKISAQGPKTMNVYKNGTGYIDSINLIAFCKTGRSIDDYIQTNVPCTENNVDRDIETIDINSRFFDVYHYVFRKKADAAKFLEALKEHDKQMLADFNKTYKTEHEYPF